MAQWIEHPTSNRGVAGSSPARGSNLKFFFVTIRGALVAQWVAHPTSNRGVAGSTPARSALKGQYFKRCGAAEACLAHNQKVTRSKLVIAILIIRKIYFCP